MQTPWFVIHVHSPSVKGMHRFDILYLCLCFLALCVREREVEFVQGIATNPYIRHIQQASSTFNMRQSAEKKYLLANY